jgi:hypothetical protein
VSSKASQITVSSQNLVRKSTNPFDFDVHDSSAAGGGRVNHISEESQQFRASSSINFQDFTTFFSKFDQKKFDELQAQETDKNGLLKKKEEEGGKIPPISRNAIAQKEVVPQNETKSSHIHVDHVNHVAQKNDLMVDSIFGTFNPVSRSDTEKITQDDLDLMKREIFPSQFLGKRDDKEHHEEDHRLWDERSEVVSQDETSVRKSDTYYFSENK